MIKDVIQDLLDCAPDFDIDGGPTMERREYLGRELGVILSGLLPALTAGGPLARLDMRVKAGGRQSNYSPVPWVRVFSHEHSPRTSSGYYVVFLFNGTGDRAYLSLNQGTSVPRAQGTKMRPTGDTRALADRANSARRLLREVASPLWEVGVPVLDLGVSTLDVGPESKKRARNYEHANVWAIEYLTGSIPEDSEIITHLNQMLHLLGELYLRTRASATTPSRTIEPT